MVDFHAALKRSKEKEKQMAIATKKRAAAKKTTSLAKWSDKFAQYAKKSAEQLKNVGNIGMNVKFGRNVITIGDREIKGPIEVVILGFAAHNRWWEAAYDSDNTTVPDCYAFSEAFNDSEMKPHADSQDKQSDQCSTCEKNKYGSANTGNGKACANTARIAMLLATGLKDAKSVAEAEIAYAGISPTNVFEGKAKRKTAFDPYVKMLAEEGRVMESGVPTWAVVTQIQSFDDQKTQIRVEFKMVEVIDDDDVLTALEKKQEEIQAKLQVPYQVIAAEDIAPAKNTAKAGSSRKFAGGKKK